MMNPNLSIVRPSLVLLMLCGVPHMACTAGSAADKPATPKQAQQSVKPQRKVTEVALKDKPTEHQSKETAPKPTPSPNAVVTAKPKVVKPLMHLRPLNPKSMVFKEACTPGDRTTVAAVGDILVHKRIQVQSLKHKDHFKSLWSDVIDLVNKADVSYANLEGPTAPGVKVGGRAVKDPGMKFDDVVYTSYPRFNYHPQLVKDIKSSGFDVVSTANNHSLDRGALGVDRTIEELKKVKLPFTGTRLSTHKKKDVPNQWHTITKQNGFTLAWVACTFSTNGLPDYKKQVLFCYEDRKAFLGLITKLSKDKSIDAVIATPHWGWEYTQRLRNQQVRLARDTIEAGAHAVIASHPHVLQKWEIHKTKDNREGFILYSLGNFVSGMDELEERATIMLYLGLTRRKDGSVVVNGVRYVPLYMYWTKARRYIQDIERGKLTNKAAKKAMRHITTLLGSYNIQPATEALQTTPQCSADWTPPIEDHAHNGWLGGACTKDADCGGAEGVFCDKSQPQGFCALSCENTCPKKRGYRAAMCAGTEASTCRVRCNRDKDCRPGYSCQKQAQANKPKRVRRVCMPASQATPKTKK